VRAFVLALLLALPAVVAVGPLPQPVPAVAPGFVVTTLAPAAGPTALAFGPGAPDLYYASLAGDIIRVPLTWTPAGPVASGQPTTVASGFAQPLGVAFGPDGAMYVSDSHANAATGRTDGYVARVDLAGTRVVVDGLPNGRHNTNHLRFGPDGRLDIANGNSNDDGVNGGAPDIFPYSGAILSVDAAQVSASPAKLGDADFAQKVQVIAHGFRNVYGVAWSPAGVAYTAMNGPDTFPQDAQDALFKIAPGADYRYPFCFNRGSDAGTDITTANNPLFPAADCAGIPHATALLGWHVCATGLDVAPAGSAFGNAAFVAECGPFFPDPQDHGVSRSDTGHKVTRVTLDANGDAVAVEDFLTGLALPTDARFGPDGALYVADAGAILRVSPVAVPSAPAPTVTIAAVGTQFAPAAVVVPAGTSVTWTSPAIVHTVTTASSLDDARAGVANDPLDRDGSPDTFSQTLAPNAPVTHTFDEPGTYYYFCAYHVGASMVGVVQVV
jgi:glucose/arabinose dehydrogenase